MRFQVVYSIDVISVKNVKKDWVLAKLLWKFGKFFGDAEYFIHTDTVWHFSRIEILKCCRSPVCRVW